MKKRYKNLRNPLRRIVACWESQLPWNIRHKIIHICLLITHLTRTTHWPSHPMTWVAPSYFIQEVVLIFCLSLGSLRVITEHYSFTAFPSGHLFIISLMLNRISLSQSLCLFSFLNFSPITTPTHYWYVISCRNIINWHLLLYSIGSAG